MKSMILVLSEIDQIRKYNQNKKDRIEKAVDLIDDLIESYEYHHEKMVISDQPDKVQVTKQTIDNLEKIKKTLS